jgi:hypothetical protein
MSSVMQPLWLDYQRPLPGRQRPGFLLLAAGLLSCGLLLGQSVSLSDDMAATERQVVRLKREAERRRLLASTGQRAVDAGQLEQRMASPSAARWESLLVSLEAAGNESVTLLALEPGAREISISGEASDLGAALDYVKRLQNAAVFADAHLVKHELIKENPYRPVRFTLLAGWREGAR